MRRAGETPAVRASRLIDLSERERVRLANKILEERARRLRDKSE